MRFHRYGFLEFRENWLSVNASFLLMLPLMHLLQQLCSETVWEHVGSFALQT